MIFLEKWQSLFMIGSGIYLLIVGFFIFKRKNVPMSKVTGIYNIVIGILSLIGGIATKFIVNAGSTIFSIFVGVLMVSFIVFGVLRLFERKSR